MPIDELRYPIGKHQFEPGAAGTERGRWIDEIAATPAQLRAAVAGLSAAQLDTPYRPGGWTLRQVAHHLADSHLNAYIRTKLALTEDEPTIKPYDEARWGELPDARTGPVEPSLTLLTALHHRWVLVWRAMSAAEFGRTFLHPEHGRTMTLDEIVSLYAWHGRHHVAHITSLRRRMGWGGS
jgi:uncharacterized damage-inducible protein DinB